MASTPQETVISWLNDAYGLENNLVQVLENHAKDAKDHPKIQAKIQEHLEKTHHHADLVKNCIERLGGDTSSIKAGLSTISGKLQGMSTGASSDELVKNALADYASEQFEIASYTSLISAAQSIGDQQTAQVCQQILGDEQDMANWLMQHIPTVTQEFLGTKAKARGAT